MQQARAVGIGTELRDVDEVDGRADRSASPLAPPSETSFLDRYARSFGRSQALMLRMSGFQGGETTASGAWITDDQGARWLDFGSFGLHLLGHRHPHLLAAARDQLGRMGLSSKILGSATATRCAAALCEIAPAGLDRVVFANGGAEAVESAIKLCALATGRDEFVALEHSYHGKTIGAASLSDSLRLPAALRMAAPVHFVSATDLAAMAAHLETRRVAAVFVEPVQGEGGIRPIDPAVLDSIRELCHRTGTLFVLDEIQTGLGRCGELWRSALDAPPDILLVGKILGGGLVPVAAAVYSSKTFDGRASDPVVHASSFAGGGLAMAVATAVVEIASDPSFLGRVRERGASALAGLRRAADAHDIMADVRGEGLMIGIEFREPAHCGRAVLEAAKRRLLVSFCLHDQKVMRVYPPAVGRSEDLAVGLERLTEALSATASAAS